MVAVIVVVEVVAAAVVAAELVGLAVVDDEDADVGVDAGAEMIAEDAVL